MRSVIVLPLLPLLCLWVLCGPALPPRSSTLRQCRSQNTSRSRQHQQHQHQDNTGKLFPTSHNNTSTSTSYNKQHSNNDQILYSGFQAKLCTTFLAFMSHARAEKVLHNFAWNPLYNKVMHSFAWNPLYTVVHRT